MERMVDDIGPSWYDRVIRAGKLLTLPRIFALPVSTHPSSVYIKSSSITVAITTYNKLLTIKISHGKLETGKENFLLYNCIDSFVLARNSFSIYSFCSSLLFFYYVQLLFSFSFLFLLCNNVSLPADGYITHLFRKYSSSTHNIRWYWCCCCCCCCTRL